MKSPNQSSVKTFLNATAYKPLAENQNIGIPEAVAIDITELLEKNGVDNFFSINGVSQCDTGERGEYGEVPTETQFVVTELQLRAIASRMDRIIDASIVNAKQADALKGLINECVTDLIDECWENINVSYRSDILKSAEGLSK